MIPRIIHYCWFGRNPKPALMQKCIASWRKHCSEYEFIEWNEDNYDIEKSPQYVVQAYNAGKWAFVTDYVRLKVVFEKGGVYFDTDVELEKSIDDLLEYHAFFCSENGRVVSTGLGFGAEAGMECVRKMMDDYNTASFMANTQEDMNGFDMTTCPVRNTKALAYLIGDNPEFKEAFAKNGILFLPRDWFCPLDYSTLLPKYRTANTRGVHWYSGSWYSEAMNRQRRHDWLVQTPQRMMIRLLGLKFYTKIKNYAKRLLGKKL